MPPPLQIAIPQTSLGSDSTSKPYTLYHVTLTLPIRTHTIQKRYSDFVSLDAALKSQTGSSPPTPLPPKSWLRNTASNPSLTEDRRRGLEAYIQSIINNEDGRWRQSPAWRTFLDLPKGLSTSNNNSDSANGGGLNSDGSASVLSPTDWLDAHRDVKNHIHRARVLLKKREAAQSAGEQHAASAEAKGALVLAASGIARCEESLKVVAQHGKSGGGDGWSGSGLGEGEIRRRRDLLGASRKEVEGLETVLRSMATRSNATTSGGGSAGQAAATEGDKDQLWKGTSAGKARPGRVLGGPMKETERTRERDNEGVLQLQQEMMQEQNEDVMQLGKAVSRMKEMGIMINEELVVQNQMLGMLETDVDRVQGKLDVGKKRMGKIH